MKTRFWVNSLLILLVICAACTSCSTISDSERTEIISNAIKLADKYCTLSQTDKAIEVYDSVNKTCPDWRLMYNKAVLLNSQDKSLEAMETLSEAYKSFENTELMVLRNKIAKDKNNYHAVVESSDILFEKDPNNTSYFYDKLKALSCYDKEEAYNLALESWNNKNHSLEIAQILYDLDPKTWKTVFKALGGNVGE